MASTSKRKVDDRDSEDISCYVHNVSEIITAATSKTRYFYGNVQTNHDKVVRFVSFSPEKQSAMKSAESTKSPVKISNCVFTPKGDSVEITVRKNSQISVVKKLDFERITKMEDAAKLVTLQAIATANTTCSIKAKVVSISTTTEVNTRYGQRQVQKVTVVDDTKSMTLALWQQHVDKLRHKCYYSIENVISTYFQSELQLSTTSKTSFKPIEEFDIVEVDDSVDNVIKSVGTVISCALKIISKCVSCNKSLDIDTSSAIVRYLHCSSKQKVSQTRLTRQLNLQLDSNQKVQKFVVFNEVLNTFILKYSLKTFNNDELENFILNANELELKHNSNSDVVLNLDVNDKLTVQTQECI